MVSKVWNNTAAAADSGVDEATENSFMWRNSQLKIVKDFDDDDFWRRGREDSGKVAKNTTEYMATAITFL